MGEVDLERSLDGGWSCLELWTCVESYDDGGVGCTVPSPRVHIHRLIGALYRRPGSVPSSADGRELAELRLRYDNDKPP